jgi:hypothetical protein
MKAVTVLLVAALGLVSTACAEENAGTEVGNPILVDIGFTVHNQTGIEALAVDTAWMAVERIRLRRADVCEDEPGIVILGPIATDLLAGGAPPELTGVALRAGDYCRFEFEWDAFSTGLPPHAPPELVDAAIAITGRRGDGARFVLRSDRSDEVRMDAVNGAFTLDEATRMLFVSLDMGRLFQGVELDDAVVSADGVIYIDDRRNDDLLDRFEDNLRAASRLFRDLDGDGALAPGEAGDDDVLAR